MLALELKKWVQFFWIKKSNAVKLFLRIVNQSKILFIWHIYYKSVKKFLLVKYRKINYIYCLLAYNAIRKSRQKNRLRILLTIRTYGSLSEISTRTKK